MFDPEHYYKGRVHLDVAGSGAAGEVLLGDINDCVIVNYMTLYGFCLVWLIKTMSF